MEDSLADLEQQLVPRNREWTLNTKRQSPDPHDMLDKSLSHYFTTETSDESMLLMANNSEVIPKTYSDVLKSTHKDEWLATMDGEFKSLDSNNNVMDLAFKYFHYFYQGLHTNEMGVQYQE